MKKTVCIILCVIFIAISACASAGWIQSGSRWWYQYQDGSYPHSQWFQDNGAWYYFDSDGWMATGWRKVDGVWYYLSSSGAMLTGWLKDGGATYYLTGSGAMATGWKRIGGDWYFFNSSGAMKTRGWELSGNQWYYLGSDGKMATGWVKDRGKTYYMSSGGEMVTGWRFIGGSWYYFNSSGDMKTDGWLSSGNKWYYLGSDGKMAIGWVKEKGKRYYTDASGAMVTGWKVIDGKDYYFDNSGVMATDWVQVGSTWYYFNDDGTYAKTGPLIGKNTGVDLTDQKSTNNDFIAYLLIPGTNVSHPVVHSDDVEHYLDYNFTGQKSKDGTLFSLGKCNWKHQSKNLSIYGHHVEGDGDRMFKALLKYKDAGYYASHQTLYLDSMYRNGKYRIFAVFDMTEGDADPSRTSFGSDQEFLDFVNYAKKRSFYDTGVEVKASDHIVTLITCDRYFKRGVGRLIVMAVEE